MPKPTIHRRLQRIDEVQGDRVLVGDRWLLNLASNNYLGLASDPRVIHAAQHASLAWGTGTGSSPLLSGYTALHDQLAEALADWKSSTQSDANPEGGLTPEAGLSTEARVSPGRGSPVVADGTATGGAAAELTTRAGRAVLFPCGYSANLAALRTLLDEDAQVFADRRNHASLVDGLRLAVAEQPGRQVRYYRHRDFADLERLLEQSSPQRPRWIVTDSVFSMDGTCTRPSDIGEIARRYSARLLVDEAHATGVLGHSGSGLFSLSTAKHSAAQPNDGAGTTGGVADGAASDGSPPVCIVGTLSKSLASQGGFVVGSWEDTERLIQGARSLIYSTSLAGSSVAAALEAIEIARSEAWRRAALQQHVRTLHTGLQQQGWRTIGDLDAPLLAVIVGDHLAAENVAAALEQRGLWAPAIRPPTVKPLECRIRLSPTATMSEEDIQQIIAAFAALRVPQLT